MQQQKPGPHAGLGIVTESYHIPEKLVGLIIGKGGEQITQLEEDSGCKVEIAPDSGGLPDRPCSLIGSPHSISVCKQLIQQIIDRFSQPPMDRYSVVEMSIPGSKVGLVIGTGGRNIRQVQERANVKMVIIDSCNAPTAVDKPLQIFGEPSRCQLAKEMVLELLAEKDMQGPGGGGMGTFNNFDGMHGGGDGPGGMEFNVQGDGGGGSSSMGHCGSPGGGGMGRGGFGDPNFQDQTQYSVPADKYGLASGIGGETIRDINRQSGAHVELDRNPLPNMEEKVFNIRGTPQQIHHAVQLIYEEIGMQRAKEMVLELLAEEDMQGPGGGGMGTFNNFDGMHGGGDGPGGMEMGGPDFPSQFGGSREFNVQEDGGGFGMGHGAGGGGDPPGGGGMGHGAGSGGDPPGGGGMGHGAGSGCDPPGGGGMGHGAGDGGDPPGGGGMGHGAGGGGDPPGGGGVGHGAGGGGDPPGGGGVGHGAGGGGDPPGGGGVGHGAGGGGGGGVGHGAGGGGDPPGGGGVGHGAGGGGGPPGGGGVGHGAGGGGDPPGGGGVGHGAGGGGGPPGGGGVSHGAGGGGGHPGGGGVGHGAGGGGDPPGGGGVGHGAGGGGDPPGGGGVGHGAGGGGGPPGGGGVGHGAGGGGDPPGGGGVGHGAGGGGDPPGGGGVGHGAGGGGDPPGGGGVGHGAGGGGGPPGGGGVGHGAGGGGDPPGGGGVGHGAGGGGGPPGGGGMGPGGFGDPNFQDQTQYSVPADKYGLVSVKGGETIYDISLQSGALVELDRNPPPDMGEKVFNICGNPQQIHHAVQLISEKAGMQGFPGGPVGPGPDSPGPGGFEQFDQYGQPNQLSQQYGAPQGWNAYGNQYQQQPSDPNAADKQAQDTNAVAWVAYYPQYYANYGSVSPAINLQTGQPNYIATWAEYYRQQGMYHQANMILQQAQANAAAAVAGQPQQQQAP